MLDMKGRFSLKSIQRKLIETERKRFLEEASPSVQVEMDILDLAKLGKLEESNTPNVLLSHHR
jgi:hypothetical protein